jgi:hypothetical protein
MHPLLSRIALSSISLSMSGCCFGALPGMTPEPPATVIESPPVPPTPPAPEPGLEIGSVVFCDSGDRKSVV